MRLTSDQVKKVAKLANLPIQDTEVEAFSSQLSEILNYVDLLEKSPAQGVESLFNVAMSNVGTQGETVSNVFTQEEALSAAPQQKDGFFISKGVFKDE
ncbi:MAG: Asp-tRNA(Asn)/Glu-tRNA(Gln) amidotransferase subunit GatC [Candidatus Daviesbacteria bacterium]|nr:Asp-tRNA(Asn)/Glu-tRNA(Gln) amidotransferase subunit GatC [Candidatus Daviesbacteria bacterium]